MTRSIGFRTLGLMAVAVLLSCFRDSTGPGEHRRGAVAFTPVFSQGALLVVNFERVRIRLFRPGTAQTAVDTTVSFPANADSVSVPLRVPLQSGASSEAFDLKLAMINAASDTVFRGGPTRVTAAVGVGTQAPNVPMVYTGVGSNAAGVRFVAAAATAFFGDTVAVVAEALDSSSKPIPGTPVLYSVHPQDTVRAHVPDPSTGRVVAGFQRGPARIIATLLCNHTAATTLRVQPRPEAMAITAGNAQSGQVGAPLAQPLAVRVTAADGLGVEKVVVSFAVTSGGGTLSQVADTTDANGDASVGWTLGSGAGQQTATAAASGIAATSIFTATAAPAAPAALVFTTQPPASQTAGAALNVEVEARDAFGNRATGFTGNVAVAITGGTGTAGAALTGTTTVTAVVGIATFSGLAIDRAGTGYTLAASGTGLTSATSAAFDVAAGAASQLVFTTQPANTTAGSAFGVVVTARDNIGNAATGFTGNVTVTITNGTGTAGANLTGTASAAAVAGVATFTGLSIDSAGTGYTLTASATGPSSAVSGAFNIAAGTASQLVFTVKPANTTAGSGFGVVVTARDNLGNTATGFTGSVAVAITGGTGTAGANLTGTATVAAVGGIATFTGLAIDRAGTGYTLTASATGLSNAVSSAFDIVSLTASQLLFTTQPTNTTAGSAFGVVVTARDAQGNTASGFTGNVTVAITGGTGTAGASLTGTTTVASVGGIATFAGLAIDREGAGYTLTASATGLTSTTSAAFDIAAGLAGQLAFTTQPANTTAGSGFGVVVTARDAQGNTATGFTGNVTVAITGGTGTAGANLTGTATVAAVGGIAAFSGLTIDRAGTGYTLTASATGPSSAVSTAFDIAAGSAGQLVFTTQPANTTAGSGFGVVVTARDAQGNTATGFTGNVTVAITSGTGTAGATLTGTATIAAVGGIAAFTGLGIDSSGIGYTLTASASGPSSAVSGAFNVTAGTASRLVFITQPANTTAGAGFGVVVSARDNLGNTATGFTGSLTVAITGGTGTTGANLTGTATVAAVDGIATFTGLAIDSVGTGYTLTASATGLSSATSSAFDVAAGTASELVFTTQPTNTTAGSGFGVVVTARDNLGNTAIGFTGNVMVAITGGTGTAGANLTGSATVAAVSGIASFTGLAIDRSGTGYTLTATATGVTSAVSSGFDVGGAAAAPEVDAGSMHTCGLRSGGLAYCWGENSWGELGDGTWTMRRSPVAVSGGLTFTQLTAGGDIGGLTCGLTSAGVAYCWGFNNDGALGDGTWTESSSPDAVSGGLTFTQLTAGGNHTCGLAGGGLAYCWGDNLNGQLGDGTSTVRSSPVAVSGGLTFTQLSAGIFHTCGLTSAGIAYCWGINGDGTLGDGTTTSRNTPVAVSGGLTFTQLTASAYHTCGLTSSGLAYCWGFNYAGELGVGTTTGPEYCGAYSCSTVPVAVVGGLAFSQLTAGYSHTCGRTSSGLAYCWGANYHGPLGDGTQTLRAAPVAVSGGLTFDLLAAGSWHTCGLTSGGLAYCWGENGAGQLGDGSTVYRLVPVQVAGFP